jgi:hypothetical protein
VDPFVVYRAYSDAWNEARDPERRNALLAESWSDDGVLVDEETPDGIVGRAALAEYIAETHRAMPGLAISDVTTPQVLGGRMRVQWIAHQDGEVTYTGTDLIELAPDGRIARVTMFYDPTASTADID